MMAALVRNQLRRLGFISIYSLPVIAFCFKFAIIYRHGALSSDWGYFAQLYESARRSILEFHQFPWWNPWQLGGVPLYANPQFGLFSIPMLFTLVFGTVVGLHLAIVVYFLLGFWGMHALLRKLRNDSMILPLLLSYVWVFSGFPVAHAAVGHLTFMTYLLSPWFFVALLNIRTKYGWLWFGLITALLIEQAPHYIVIEMLLIGAVVIVCWLAYQYHRNKRIRVSDVAPFLKGGGIVLFLSGLRVLYVFQYLHEFPRFTPTDAAVSLSVLLAALFLRNFKTLNLQNLQYGWWEYVDYISTISAALLSYLLLAKLVNYDRFKKQQVVLLLGTACFIVLAMGQFALFSPFSLLHHLPVLNQMRVPSRWVGWASLGMLILLVYLPKKTAVYILLGLAAVDVFTTNYGLLNYPQEPYRPVSSAARSFQQSSGYNAEPLSLLATTQANRGAIFGYEPILGFYPTPNTSAMRQQTDRCGVEQGCGFVISHNAVVTYWSPQKITLRRMGSGVITLNMNPGKFWLVNGVRIFPNSRELELRQQFNIFNSAKYLTVTFKPKL